MLKELESTLAYPRLQPRLLELKLEIADLLAYVVDSITLIELNQVEAIVKADPDDDVFVNCAAAVGAPYLISGNKHLLNLKQWRSVRIVSPQDFLAREFAEAEIK
jgi:putative PIN family toxin of toxin-antitoxin system